MTATAQTVDPWTTVTLPAPSGSWTLTSGTPTVTLAGGRTFTAPATRAGSVLLFADTGSNTATITVQPDTWFWCASDGSFRPMRVSST